MKNINIELLTKESIKLAKEIKNYKEKNIEIVEVLKEIKKNFKIYKIEEKEKEIYFLDLTKLRIN